LATDFGARGTPNGWKSKEGFLFFEIVIIGVIGILQLALPRFLKVPTSMVNIPNREYWLSDERNEKTLQTLNREMGWVFVSVLAFLISVNHLVYQANLTDGRTLSDSFLFSVYWFPRIYRGLDVTLF